VPVDAYKALKKIDTSVYAPKLNKLASSIEINYRR